MPRPFRYTLPGIAQHVVQRGNARQATFFHEDDYGFYLACLREAARRHGVLVHAYVLMTNHVHLLVMPTARHGISRMLQSVGRRYVQFVNFNHRRSGTLWEGRHKASLVQTDEYLAACHRYVELNPVRAGMVADPLGYRWSSCRHYAGDAQDPVITDSPVYLRSGRTLDERRAAHRAALAAGLDVGSLTCIRVQTERGGVIGNDRFRAQIERMLAQRLPGAPRGRPRKRSDEGSSLSAGASAQVDIEDALRGK
jgi:putative transposase